MSQPSQPEDKRRPGRPYGSRGTRLQEEAIKAASRTGMLPHEILLDMARGMPQRCLKFKEMDEEHGVPVVEESWVTLTVEDRKDAAKAAAPYYAPKLSSVETTERLNDDDLDELIKQFAAQAGVGALAGGEGTQEQGAEGAGDQPRNQGRRRGVFGD